jgi:hypothetical protein
MWGWTRMEKISWNDSVKNEEVLHTVTEEKNILHTIKGRKANWIGHTLHRNCILKLVTEGKIEGTRRQKKCMQLQDDLNETRRYCNFYSLCN